MYNAIWESGLQWLLVLLTGLMDKISTMSLYAFSPQFTTFVVYFPVATIVYNLCIYISLALGVTLFLFKLIANIFNPESKSYESPFSLVKRFCIFLIGFFLLPVLLNLGSRMANTVYWDIVYEIETNSDVPEIVETSDKGIWTRLARSLEGVIEATDNSNEIGETDKETWGQKLADLFTHVAFGSLSVGESMVERANDILGFAGNIIGIVIPDEINLVSGVSDIIDDGIENFDDAMDSVTDGNWSANRLIDNGFTSAVLSFILTLYVAWQYLLFVIEMGERYIVFVMLTFLSPLALAPLCSRDTADITKRFGRMYISQLMVLAFSALFLCLFRVGIYTGASMMASFEIDPGHGIEAGRIAGAYIYLVLLAAFLKMGQRMDSYLNSLGLSTAQTGMGLGMMFGQFAMQTVRTGTQMISRSNTNSQREAAQAFNMALNDRKTAPGSISSATRGNLDMAESGVPKGGKVDGGLDIGSLGPEEAKNALAEVAHDGYSGFTGDAGISYAQELFQKGDNPLIPEGANITGADIDTTGGGKVSYTDEDGNKHTVDISKDQPDEGVFKAGTDSVGDDYYAFDAEPEVPEDKLDRGGRREVEDLSDTALAGTNEEEAREAFNMGDDGYFVDNGDGTYSAFDGAGNEVASSIRNTDDVGDCFDAYTDLNDNGNYAVIANDDGSFTSGIIHQPSQDDPNLVNFDNRYLETGDGVKLSGELADGSKVTDINAPEAKDASWKMASEDFDSKDVSYGEAKKAIKDKGGASISDKGNYLEASDGTRFTGTLADGSKVTDINAPEANDASWKMETKGYSTKDISFDEAKQAVQDGGGASVRGSSVQFSHTSNGEGVYTVRDNNGTRTLSRAEAQAGFKNAAYEQSFDGRSVSKVDTAPKKAGEGKVESLAQQSDRKAPDYSGTAMKDNMREAVARNAANGYSYSGKSLDAAAKLQLGETINLGDGKGPQMYTVTGGRGFLRDGSQEYKVQLYNAEGKASGQARLKVRESEQGLHVGADGRHYTVDRLSNTETVGHNSMNRRFANAGKARSQRDVRQQEAASSRSAARVRAKADDINRDYGRTSRSSRPNTGSRKSFFDRLRGK